VASHRIHQYRVSCAWSGSTGQGYEKYSRAHEVRAEPATPTLSLSSDPAFRGDPRALNPEQLLLAAASSCQLLAFLAEAARAQVDVVRYFDEAEAEMPEDEQPVRFRFIRLKPRIEVARGPSLEQVLALVARGHDGCYIANSLKTPVTVEPLIEFV
jgi:organic hydroperoxide reductase OsmC/OhrA